MAVDANLQWRVGDGIADDPEAIPEALGKSAGSVLHLSIGKNQDNGLIAERSDPSHYVIWIVNMVNVFLYFILPEENNLLITYTVYASFGQSEYLKELNII